MKIFSVLKIYHKPKSLSHHQAASLPYAGLTAWSALSLTAQLGLSDSQKSKSVLVIGASGGVGTIAVQLLKIWNCKVRYLVFKFKIRNNCHKNKSYPTTSDSIAELFMGIRL